MKINSALTKTILYSALGAAALTIGFAACDPATPPNATLEPEAITEGETLADITREALVDILRDEDAYSRARRLGTLLPTLGSELASTVAETLEDRKHDLGVTELDLLVRHWTLHQPEDASSWAMKESPTIHRAAAVFSAVTVWAEVDPQAAANATWDWALNPDYQRIVPTALVRGWLTTSDRSELERWISDLPPGVPRQRAIIAFIYLVIQRRGAEAVTRWAESLPDDDETYKLAVFRRVVDALSKLDIEAAMRWCEIQCDGPYGKNMRSLIARSWVVDDGAAALAWLSSADEGYERDHAARLTFAKWGREDREAALDWMAAQTAGEPEPWLRPLYPAYAKLLAADAPADAIKWAERIEGESEREQVLIQIARVWRHLDEAAAEDWLLQSSLSEEARESARTPVE